jgi:hypothetical protein
MSRKTLLHRLFGLGKLPKGARPAIDAEGIVLVDEGIGGWVKLRRFRAPGRYHSSRSSWFTGSLVITGLRFAAFAFSRPIINVPLAGERLGDLEITASDDRLVVRFEASQFNPQHSGSVEYRFRTDLARSFAEHVEAALRSD